MWFRDIIDMALPGETHYVATGFLVSEAADRFVDLISDEKDINQQAGTLLLEQLVKMLNSMPASPEIIADPTLIVDTLIFDWKDDAPFARGGYMYPKVGITPSHLHALAEPFGRCFFAGEATNTNACCTVQAAMETGQRAATEVESLLGQLNK